MVATWHAGLLSAWLFAQVGTGTSWDARVERAIALRLSGQEEEALSVFREAQKERSSPRLVAQMALAEQSLGLWVHAEAHLERALLDSDDTWIAKNLAALLGAREIIRGHLGTLELRGEPRGVLRVDGRVVAPYERALRLEVGHHRIEIARAGAYPFQRDVEIRANETSRETAVLTEITEAGPRGADLPRAPNATRPVDPPTGRSSASASRTVGIGLVSVGVAAALTGVATLLVSNVHATDYNADPNCRGRAGDPPSCDADASAARTYRIVSIASFITAGIGGLTGGYFLWRASAGGPVVRAVVSDSGAFGLIQHSF